MGMADHGRTSHLLLTFPRGTSFMKPLDMLAAILLVIGGLNWGLVAFANFDLVATITGAGEFGNKNMLGVIIYGLVGLAALYQALAWKAIQRRWQSA
jgi:uncharacterized membrane protein YuzA (DUF378 family)